MMTLRERGLPIYDLGDVVAATRRDDLRRPHPFLRDAAGESDGYRLMAARVGELLAETWGLQRKP